MDKGRLIAAVIRFFWASVFPLIGVLVAWLAEGQNLQSIGVENTAIIALVSGFLYGIKKAIWPDTKL